MSLAVPLIRLCFVQGERKQKNSIHEVDQMTTEEKRQADDGGSNLIPKDILPQPSQLWDRRGRGRK